MVTLVVPHTGLIVILCLLQASYGFIGLAPLYSDGMIFQEGKSSRIWGLVNTGILSVNVEFQGKKYKTSLISSNGYWEIKLDPPHLQVTPTALTIESVGTGGEKKTLNDILVGDVFLCSGQSNMEISVVEALNATQEIAAANYPNIRIVKNAMLKTFFNVTEPQRHAYVDIPWGPVTPSRIPTFSGFCYYFGRDLHNHFNGKRPIGLIESCWGGTPIQVWSSPTAMTQCHSPVDPHCANATMYPSPRCGSTLFNSMITPWTPLALKGFVWDQGEANDGQPNLYECQLPAMSENWKKMYWKDDTLPFVYRQLHAYPAGGRLGPMRYAQAVARGTGRGMVTSYDLGYLNSTDGNIHFMDKQEIGRRGHLAMRHLAYAETTVQYTGPRATYVKVIDYGKGGLKYYCGEVGFEGVSVENPLRLVNGWPPFSGVEIEVGAGPGAYTNSQWTPVVVTLHSATSIWFNFTLDGAEALKPPTHVRYVWFDIPVTSLYDTVWNLPAVPFNFTLPPPPEW